jgi:hypothetical protein
VPSSEEGRVHQPRHNITNPTQSIGGGDDDDQPILHDPALARLAERFGESEALYALRCADSEEEAAQLLAASLEEIRGGVEKTFIESRNTDQSHT